jgi:xylulokinase
VAGLGVHAGPTQSGADSRRWWGDAIGHDVAGVLDLASKADRSRRPVLFLPHLEGERAPLWDAELRGAFIGLDGRSGGPEHALAVMGGVALSARMLLASLDVAGRKVPRLLHAGGGARSDLWGQIRAHCLGRPRSRLLSRCRMPRGGGSGGTSASSSRT